METNKPETVCLNDSKLFTINDFLTESQCDSILEFIEDNSINFIDRSKKAANVGLDGSIGRYDSMLLCNEIHPDTWDMHFSKKSINGIPLDSVMINRYYTNDFIPKHKDKQGSIFTVCVPLQTSQDSLVFVRYSLNGDEHDIVCNDIKGTGYGFFGNSPVHYVPEVKSDVRYSLICLYGVNTY